MDSTEKITMEPSLVTSWWKETALGTKEPYKAIKRLGCGIQVCASQKGMIWLFSSVVEK